MKEKLYFVILIVMLTFGIIGCRANDAELGNDTSTIGETIPAATYSEPTIVLSQENAHPGDIVDIKLEIKQSPGIAMARFVIEFDNENLDLQSVKYGTAFLDNSDEPANLNSPMVLLWSQLENITGDNLFAEMTFKVNDKAKPFRVFPITAVYVPSDVINLDEDIVYFAVENGSITITK